MNDLKKKLKKQEGFTLVEMLIVVAIIAILIMVSIPMINTSLEKARQATDKANERAAKAEAAIVYLSGGDIDGTAHVPGNKIDDCYYDNISGTLTLNQPNKYGQASNNTDNVIQVSVDDKGLVTTKWVAGK